MLVQPVEESFSVEVFPFIYRLQVYWRSIQGLFFDDFIWLLGQSSLWDYFFFFVFFLVFVFFASFIISLSFTLLSFFSFDFFWSLLVFFNSLWLVVAFFWLLLGLFIHSLIFLDAASIKRDDSVFYERH